MQEIKVATEIPEADLQRNLQSLACAKYKILKKHPPGRDINSTDSFSFNVDFSAPLQKIKISTVSSRPESNDERKETRDHIDEERRHQTDVSAWIQVGRDERADFVRAGLYRAHHEGPQAVWAQRPYQRSHETAG